MAWRLFETGGKAGIRPEHARRAQGRLGADSHGQPDG